MKKAFITLSVILLTAMSAFAGGGDKDRNTRYLLSKPAQNWFIDASVSGSFFQSDDFSFKNFGVIHGPFIGASVRFGKMFLPTLGFRFSYDYHPSTNHNYATVGYFSYKNAHVDILFSPMDLFAGYNPKRSFNLYLYGGMGLMGYDVEGGKFLITSSSALELGINGGFMNCFRLSEKLDFHIDLQGTLFRWSYDQIGPTTSGYRAHTDWEVLAGLIWYFTGRTFETGVAAKDVVDCSEQENRITELTQQVNQLQNDLSNCQSRLNASTSIEQGQTTNAGQAVADTIVKYVESESISYPFSIFFNKGSYDLRDGRDRVNLAEFAKAAKNNGYKIILRGTCDSGTASSAFNKTLSENRCNKIKQELVKLGVAESNITIDAVGGVQELTPAEYDRRVLIQLSK